MAKNSKKLNLDDPENRQLVLRIKQVLNRKIKRDFRRVHQVVGLRVEEETERKVVYHVMATTRDTLSQLGSYEFFGSVTIYANKSYYVREDM